MKTVLEIGDIEKRIRLEGQRGQVVQVTAVVIFAGGEAYLQAVEGRRFDTKRGADLGSIVDVIAQNLPTNGTQKK